MATIAAAPPPFFGCLSSSNTSLHFDAKIRFRVRVTATSSASSSSSSLKKAERGDEFLPNARRRKIDPTWCGGGCSLGVDLGDSRTGLAVGIGYAPSPLTVLKLRGQKLELRLLDIAEEQEVDEFIIGLPKSHDGEETVQSNKVRSFAGRFAVGAAERGLKVFLQNEHGTSQDALDYMIDMGLKRSARQGKIDAYSALMVLERYFSMSGRGTELVLPKQLELQEKLLKGPCRDLDF